MPPPSRTPSDPLAAALEILTPFMSRETVLESAGYSARAIQSMREQIQAEEDQRIFDAMDRIAADGTFSESRQVDTVQGPYGQVLDVIPGRIHDISFVAHPTDPHTVLAPHVEIDGPTPYRPGRGEPGLSPSSIQGRRVEVPMFELAANPTIRLEEIRHRRFDLIDRTPLPPPVPVPEMTPTQMEKVALILRRPFWDRIMLVEDDFPVPRPPPPLPLHEQIARKIDEQVLGEWGRDTKDNRRTAWQRLGEDF